MVGAPKRQSLFNDRYKIRRVVTPVGRDYFSLNIGGKILIILNILCPDTGS